MLRRGLAYSIVLLVLSACGGGGQSVLPQAAPSAPSGPGAVQNVKVSITIPARVNAASSARRPLYVSGGTQSAAISVNDSTTIVDLSPNSKNCSQSATGRVCTVNVSAPPGKDRFTEKLFASNNGTGPVLAQGSNYATIAPGTSNVVALTLGGVPASASLQLDKPAPDQNGVSQTLNLTITIKDAAGSTILGADAFVSPITLVDSDTSGVTSLSRTSLLSPNDAASVQVTYTGAALTTPAVFNATGSGLNSGNVTPATLSPKPVGIPQTAFNDYATFGFDNRRDAFNPNSANISPANLSNLHLAWHTSMGDYNTQTQPILATNVGGHAGVLIVGGGSGKVYGYDALSGSQLWKHSLGQITYTCATAGQTVVFGVGGSAAYQPQTKTFYIVGNSNPGLNQNSSNTLYHMNAADGAILGSVNFAPDPVGPSELDFSHTSVTLNSNGLAYVGTGATCDISSWRGRVSLVDTNSMTLSRSFFPVWNPAAGQYWGGGGVWGWGGVSLDDSGNVYTGFGNTDNGTTTQGKIVSPFVKSPTEYSGYGESFAKLSPGITTIIDSTKPIPQDYYGRTNEAADLDINSTPLLVQPNGVGCNMVAAVQGKAGALFMFDTTNIGGGPIASYQLAPTTYKDQFIGDAGYSPVTGLIYAAVPVGAGSLYPPGLVAIDPGCNSRPNVVWHAQFGPDSNLNGNFASRSVPAASAGGLLFVGTPCQPDGNGGCNGSLTPKTAATARSIQGVRRPQLCCAPPGTGTAGAVWVLNAATGEVLNGGLPLITTPGVIRMPPTIDGNWVYVLDNNGDMYAFTVDPAVPAVQSTFRAADSRSTYIWESAPRH